MVRRNISDRTHCRPPEMSPETTVNSSNNDDSNRSRRPSVTECAPNTVSADSWPAFMDSRNIQGLICLHDSGEAFQVTRTHPEPRKIHADDPVARRLARSSVEATEDSDYADTVSESRRARALSGPDSHCRSPKRKRGGPNSATSAAHKKRRSARIRKATPKSDYSFETEEEDEDDKDDDGIDELEGSETEMMQIRVDEVHLWYYEAFRAIRQLACKDILKAWIRFGHETKQTLYPYNGGKSSEKRKRSMENYGYEGHFSKPDYWPSDDHWWRDENGGARHKEPDHLKKNERLLILVHLLRSQNRGFKDGDFGLKILRQSTDGIHQQKRLRKHWTLGYVECLSEIYRVREQELEYEQGQIDGDTLVTVEMPKPSRKVPQAPKAAVKTAKLPSKQIKKEVDRTRSVACNAPVAEMRALRINVHDNENVDLDERSGPSILGDTSSPTEEVTPDASCPDPTLRNARTVQDWLPFVKSPSPEQSRHTSVQANWSAQLTYFGDDPAVFSQPDPYGYGVTSRDAQRNVQFGGQYCPASSSMQDFPNQTMRHQFNHSRTGFQGLSNRMRSSATSTHSPPPRPIENAYSEFAGSSTGLAGLQPGHLWNTQTERSMYTDIADSTISLLPSEIGSFSRASPTPFSSGVQNETHFDGNQIPMNPPHQGQTVDTSWYQPSDMHILPRENPNPANPYDFPQQFPPQFPPFPSSGTDYSFDYSFGFGQ